MFTRKHYEAVAEIIKERSKHYADMGRYGCANGAGSVGDKLADLFEKDNPRFDRDRFLAACGLN